MRSWGLLLFWLVVSTTQSRAAFETIAITGTSVSSISDAEFWVGDSVFPLARLSNDGSVAYQAVLNPTTVGMNSDNDDVIFRYDNGENHVTVREGSGGVPNAPGANYAAFNNFGIADDGSILVRGQLVTGVGGITTADNQGFWRFSESTGTEIARTTSSGTPGVPGGRYGLLGTGVRHSNSGVLAFDARLKIEGSVSSTNDYGVWQDNGISSSLLVREGQTSPGVVGTFDAFSTPSASDSGHIAFRGQLKLGGAITSTNRTGIWNYQSGVGSLVARTGSGGVPGLPGPNFTAFEDPVLNSSGQLLLNATLNSGNSGLWRYDGASGELLAIEGGAVPDVPDTTFFEIKSPLLSDIGQVVAWGHMNTSPSVSLLDDTGLWAFDEIKGNRLLARVGIEGTVPGKPESEFVNLGRYATNASGDVLLQAELNENFEDLGHQGIWLYPYDGEPQLVVQSGDSVAGRTIERLRLLTNDDTQNSVTGVFNNAGQFVFQAEFTNGDFGLFLYSPETETTYASADFNTDGYVDATDLEWWSNAFRQTALGDADDDGDTDSGKLSGLPVQTVVAVPEPTV